MTDAKDIYFLTMDNISDYMGCDDKKLTDLELGKRVKLNLSLSQKNNVLEKKKLLLNNCLLTFKLFEQNIRTCARQSSKGNQLKWENAGRQTPPGIS